MKPIYITGKRNGYAPDQCGKTLTVGELIEMLEEFDDCRPVYLMNDGGYTFGSITDRDIMPHEDIYNGDID